MTFQSGEDWKGNAKGRAPGSRNKRTQEIINLIQSKPDYKDPLDFLADVIAQPNHYSNELKVQASNILAPYLHSKRSVLIPPRFIETPVQVPEFNSIGEAENYLSSLPARVGRSEISFDDAEKISLLTRNYIEASVDAAKLQLQIAHQGGEQEQIIHICGGMPRMPGHENLIMPEFNKGDINGTAIEHQPDPPLENRETKS
jgi:hypothetical protein